MDSDKFLYKFTVNKTTEVDEVTTSKDEAGAEVKTIKKVKKETPVSFGIRKPNRKLREGAEMFYAVKMSEGVKAGLLTRPLLAKRYVNDGGSMSDPEKARFAEAYVNLLAKEDEIQKIQLNLENLSEEDKKAKLVTVVTEMQSLKNILQDINLQQSSLFEHTAEAKAETKTIFWWVLHLAYEGDEKGDFKPIFGDGDYESRVLKYEEIEEKEDLFWDEVFKKFGWYVAAWVNGAILSKDDFERVTKVMSEEEKQA